MNVARKFLLVSIALISLLFYACEKDNVTPDDEFDETTTTCKIEQVVRVDGGNTDILSFGYNDTDALRRIGERHDGEATDYKVTEVEFNDDGTIRLIEEYDIASNPDFLLRSYTYTWSGGKIITIVEQRNDVTSPYSKTYTYAYNGDNLASITESGDPDGENMKMTDIVYEKGNMKSATIDFSGDGLITAKLTASFDDKYNHAKHLLPLPEVMLESFNNNNIISVELAEEVNLIIITYPAGSKILDRSYTYNDENEVAIKTDKPGILDDSGGNRTYTVTYICD